MVEAKYEEMYKQLKESAEQTMQSKSISSCIDDFKNAVEERVKSIHNEIDEAEKELLEFGLKYFNSEQPLQVSSKTGEIEPMKIDESSPFVFKANLLTKYINQLTKQSDLKAKFVNGLYDNKDKEYSLMRYTKEGKMEFKITNRLKGFCSNKVPFELGWLKTQNQPSYSSIDANDESTLIVKGQGCYNYYRTDKDISGENVCAEFEAQITQDNYFYFGVHNESCTPSSNCMCCNPSYNCYIWHTGKISVHGSSSDEKDLEWKSLSSNSTTLRIRVLATEKECYFQVGDRDEKGPYKLQGERFTITFGSCNTSSGKIKIVSSYYC